MSRAYRVRWAPRPSNSSKTHRILDTAPSSLICAFLYERGVCRNRPFKEGVRLPVQAQFLGGKIQFGWWDCISVGFNPKILHGTRGETAAPAWSPAHDAAGDKELATMSQETTNWL